MDLSQKAAVIVFSIFGLGVCLSVSSGIESASETAQQFAPIPQATAEIALDRRKQEAQVTATYIAVLSSEVVSDTQHSHALERIDNEQRQARSAQLGEIANYAKMGVVISGAIGLSLLCIGAGYGFGKRLSVVHVPLKDGAHLLPGNVWIDTRTALVSSTKKEYLPQMHAKDLLEYRAVVVKALASAFVENGGVKLLTGGNNNGQ